MTIFAFGPFELDTHRCELRRDGTVYDIEPKPFNLLVHLITCRDRVVSRTELLEHLWAGVAVKDSVITRCLNVARQAVGDDGKRQHTIKTVHGTGYRFIAEVFERSREGSIPPPPSLNPHSHVLSPQVGSETTSAEPNERLTIEGSALNSSTSSPLAQIIQGQPTPPAGTVSPGTAPTRRQMTVMRCGLAAAPALASQLDPEDLNDILQAFYATGADIIEHFGGFVAQYLDDGLLAYFGYPQAHEDAAARAIRAALGVVEAIKSIQTRLDRVSTIQIEACIGIHTGLVVIDAVARAGQSTPMAIGETPHVVAQVQQLAAPSSVAITATTARLVRGLFACQSLPDQTLTVGDAPVELFQVRSERSAQSRWDVVLRSGLPPMVGREAELGLLTQRWRQACVGSGQVIQISGEPGIGKSRLVEAMRRQITRQDRHWLTFRCSPQHQQGAFYPVLMHLQRVFQFRDDDSPTEKVAKIERLVHQSHLPAEESVPLLAAFLSLSAPDHYPPLFLAPKMQRQKTEELLINWLLQETERQPVVMICEDLHWADTSSLALLGKVLDQAPLAHLMVILTFRSTFRPPWSHLANLTQLTLNRLGQSHVEQMVNTLTDGKALPNQVLEQALSDTDGVPLFVEEWLYMLLESNVLSEQEHAYVLVGQLPNRSVPLTLNDLLLDRLDRLGEAKKTAQLAAALGRSFTFECLQAATTLEEADLLRHLRRLVDTDLVNQKGFPPRATYAFKHALIQEVAYQSLPKRVRRQCHQHIATVLSTGWQRAGQSEPEVIAHHYTLAGLSDLAIPYWFQAGQQAMKQSANTEAVAHLTRGIDLLATQPETPERIQLELNFQHTLRSALVAIQGVAAPEVEAVSLRAEALCRQLGHTPERIWVLRSLCAYHIVRSNMGHALELAAQALELAQQTQNPIERLGAHASLGVTLMYRGNFIRGQDHLEQALELYDQHWTQDMTAEQSTDLGVSCLSHLALLQWILGMPDQAQASTQRLMRLANKAEHPYSMAEALYFLALFYQFCHEPEFCSQQAEACIDLSAKYGFQDWLGYAVLLKSWAQTELGAVEEGLTQLQRSLDLYQAIGIGLARPFFLGLQGMAHARTDQPEDGLPLLDEALKLAEESEEYYFAAELHRMKGELLQLAEPEAPVAALACLQQSLNAAHLQQAKSLELRTVLSLCDFLKSQNRLSDARGLLEDVCGRFTEGFRTPELQRAKLLLQTI